jgi:acyl-CoA reductase-like NAD-dependent aldehyde dehydrogenase
MLIGGEFRAAISGETLDSFNPATGELIGRFPRGRAEDVDAAVRAAHGAFPAWRAAGALERARLVNRLAQAIVDNAEGLALIDVRDNGSPIAEMRSDAHIAAAMLRHMAGIALELRGVTVPTGFERVNYTLPEPFGVVGRIVPFNHPLMFAAAKLGAPLVAGNTIVVKPSEHTSLSALRLGEICAEVMPPGVVNIVTGLGTEAGDALAAHPLTPRLAFTGSVATGQAIQARAATAAIKTITLELGGKNPIVVFPDADIEDAIDGVVRGMNFTWQSQSCGSTSRLLVHRSIQDEFVARLSEKLATMTSGSPEDDATEMGAMAHRGQYEKVLSYIDIGNEEGAKLATGGGPAAVPGLEGGLFVRPTLFDGVDPGSRLAQEEIFGPVLAAIPFADYDEAIRIANGVQYGLTASVFTRDLGLAHRFARDVEAGFVWVNDSSRHFPGTPYGGVKNSGLGREESIEELVSYTAPKNVNVKFE